MSDPLADAVTAAAGGAAVVRMGTVQAISPTLQIAIDQTVIDPANMGVLGGYSPNVGDVVAMLGQSVQGSNQSASTWLVLGNPRRGDSGAHLARGQSSVVVAIFTTTSGPYTTAGAAVCGFTFKAPASGRALVTWDAELAHGASFLLVSPQVASGTVVAAGTVFPGWGADDNRTRRNDAAATARSASTDRLDGLTPGADYNIALYHRVGGGTGTIGRRTVTVSPEM